ncbi:hypothetical protein EFD56_14970 [Rhizobium phaseoli]|nr:hypothetical protein RHECNPAF_1740092 [Rhizobium etli CNPAF512]PWI54780.1 hypothetical protein B5K03_08640 [Rhizobium phaseoli]RUM18746.1 hypothetical protein EFD56_14970 [Rhizobium phaseoli]
MRRRAGNRKSMPSVIVIYNLVKILGWEAVTVGGRDPDHRNLATASGGRVPCPRFEMNDI